MTHVVWATLGARWSEAWVRYVHTEVHQGVLTSDDVLVVGQERPRDHGDVLEAELQPRLVVLAVHHATQNISLLTTLEMGSVAVFEPTIALRNSPLAFQSISNLSSTLLSPRVLS